jgi:hypothetical protein
VPRRSVEDSGAVTARESGPQPRFAKACPAAALAIDVHGGDAADAEEVSSRLKMQCRRLPSQSVVRDRRISTRAADFAMKTRYRFCENLLILTI